ncbi:MAG TPA: hypothetical protein PKK06_08570 [Phycisphaerae bacterium]|nr:hypothetical protein [Phycisphaerae bacterium]HNU45237.1 hypothetical protein [Phycisphaerae bacterium]
MNNATYDACVAACQAGRYSWCRWTPSQQCQPGYVCDGPNAQLIHGCADPPVPAVAAWGVLLLASGLAAGGSATIWHRHRRRHT